MINEDTNSAVYEPICLQVTFFPHNYFTCSFLRGSEKKIVSSMMNVMYHFDKARKEVRMPQGFLEKARLQKTFIQHSLSLKITLIEWLSQPTKSVTQLRSPCFLLHISQEKYVNTLTFFALCAILGVLVRSFSIRYSLFCKTNIC